jgi:hypothetical protein
LSIIRADLKTRLPGRRQPTRARNCMNGVALTLVAPEEAKK